MIVLLGENYGACDCCQTIHIDTRFRTPGNQKPGTVKLPTPNCPILPSHQGSAILYIYEVNVVDDARASQADVHLAIANQASTATSGFCRSGLSCDRRIQCERKWETVIDGVRAGSYE